MKGIVIGGGLAGLSAAAELRKHCDDITIIEKENFAGGLVSSFDIEGYKIPKFFHHIIEADKVTMDFLFKWKLMDNMIKKSVKFAFYSSEYKDFFQFSASKLISFKPIPFLDRIKFGMMALGLMIRNENLKELDKIDAQSWLTSKAGEEVTKLFSQIIMHKYPIPFSQVSAAWLYNRFKLELSKSKVLFYPMGETGYDILEEKLEKASRKMVRETSVKKIEIKNNFVRKIFLDGRVINVGKDDLVVSSIPIQVFSSLAKGLPIDMKKRIQNIKYVANICLCFGLEERLTDYYWINVIGDYPIGTIVANSNLYDGHPWNVFYASNYVDQKNSILNLTDEKIFGLYLGSMEKIFRKKIRPLWFKVNRTMHGGTIFRNNFFDLLPKDEIKNLRFAGQYMKYPEERSIGAAIISGIEAANSFSTKF
jgi:protoporphyrinogen oxidase